MFLQIIGLIFGVLIVAFVARSFYVSQPLFKEKIRAPDSAFTLAPVEQALSFARTKNGKSLLVVAINRDYPSHYRQPSRSLTAAFQRVHREPWRSGCAV